MELIVNHNHLHMDGSIALTVVGDAPGQVIYWAVVSHDPLGVLPDFHPKGSLLWETTICGNDKRAVNFYLAPPSGVRHIKYGTRLRYGDEPWPYLFGEDITAFVGDNEKVIVRKG